MREVITNYSIGYRVHTRRTKARRDIYIMRGAQCMQAVRAGIIEMEGVDGSMSISRPHAMGYLVRFPERHQDSR
jgi:hypothetical protein